MVKAMKTVTPMDPPSLARPESSMNAFSSSHEIPRVSSTVPPPSSRLPTTTPSVKAISSTGHPLRISLASLRFCLDRTRATLRLLRSVSAIAVLAVAGCEGLSGPGGAPPLLVLHVPDIGQGHCVFIEAAGRWTAIDAGPPGESGLGPWLRSHLPENAALEALVLTHGDIDHAGGLDTLLAHVRVRRIVHAAGIARSPLLERACRQAASGCHAVLAGDTIAALPGIRWAVMAPAAEDSGDDNSRSLVSLLGGLEGAGLYLDPGDIDSLGEARLRARWGHGLRASILRLPHHGSRGGSTLPFLGAVAPRVALVQAGRENSYGHPHPTVLDRLLALGIPVFDTRQIGGFRIEAGSEPRMVRE